MSADARKDGSGPLGYAEEEGGLMQVGHRWYDPATGRFLSRDPAEDGHNGYVYCDNDPVNFGDPEGLTLVWLERIAQGASELWGTVRPIVLPGIKIVTIVPALATLTLAIQNTSEEARLHRRYKRSVEEAMSNGLDPEKGQEMIRKNRPGVGGPLRVIQKFWELLIDAS